MRPSRHRLAGMQFRIEEELVIERAVRQPHGDARPGPSSERVDTALRIDHLQGAGE